MKNELTWINENLTIDNTTVVKDRIYVHLYRSNCETALYSGKQPRNARCLRLDIGLGEEYLIAESTLKASGYTSIKALLSTKIQTKD